MEPVAVSNFAFTCDYAFFSEGKISMIGIFKEIMAKTVPFQHPQIFIVSNITLNSKGVFENVIKIVRERDKAEVITPLSSPITISDDKKAEIMAVVQVNNLKFEEAGAYECQIFINSELIRKLPFVIKVN